VELLVVTEIADRSVNAIAYLALGILKYYIL